jgi:deoxyribodipyrimidine photo-lyase
VHAEAPVTVVWFRRDLRVADHPALTAAAARGRVVCLFVVEPDLLARRHHQAPERLRFLRAGLEALDAELRGLGAGLVVRRGAPSEVLPLVAREAGASAVYFTRDFSPYARERGRAVAAALGEARIELHGFGGDLVVEPGELPGPNGAGYQVFTPFFRAWESLAAPAPIAAPAALVGPELGSDPLDDLPGGRPLAAAGPGAATARLEEFTRGDAGVYQSARDELAQDATSRISPYLRFGMCSPSQVGHAIGLPGPLDQDRAGFWRQIAWREFYRHHLLRRPEVARVAFKPELRGVQWEQDDEGFAAWVAGETGYPLVDAGMRQLAAEGWVHNRARMVVASFLVKDLLIDWRRGETAFMQKLLDGDPANNNGGWQWTAGTGTDAAPYFRVLSPIRQAERFDPNGSYVRRYVPELRNVPDTRIHEPWKMSPEEQRAAGCRIGADYPAPRVDHGERRQEVIERFRAAKAAASTETGPT